MLESIFGVSYRTTMIGVGTIIMAIGTAVTAQFDNDPTTIPQWGALFAMIAAGLGLMTARDNKVTSEEVKEAAK